MAQWANCLIPKCENQRGGGKGRKRGRKGGRKEGGRKGGGRKEETEYHNVCLYLQSQCGEAGMGGACGLDDQHN